MRRSNGSILYLSFDGVLQPLGYSQVVRLLLQLATAGHSYCLITLERDQDVADSGRLAAMRTLLAEAGITWRFALYRPGARGLAQNVAMLTALATRELAQTSVRLIHARGYQPATVANGIYRATGVPYIFDFRGLWVDERLEEGRWFTQPLLLRGARFVERALFDDAAGVVSLAEPGAELLRTGALTGTPYTRPLSVIPTSVDFGSFAPIGSRNRHQAPEPLRQWSQDSLLLGWVGSVNYWYQTDATLNLASRVMQQRPDAKLLCLTHQGDDMRAALARHGLSARSLVTSVTHDEIPQWIRQLDWGFQILRTSRAKAASMPTKFAEFIASGVSPVHHGCNEEVGHWVERCETGINLRDLREPSLATAASRIATEVPTFERLLEARNVLEDHFSLAKSILRYGALLSALGAHQECGY